MKKLFTQILPIFTAVFLLAFVANAQTKVGGTVKDAASKEPLIGVSVSV
jgi:hypothetical protein